jgi:hypothetical protein
MERWRVGGGNVIKIDHSQDQTWLPVGWEGETRWRGMTTFCVLLILPVGQNTCAPCLDLSALSSPSRKIFCFFEVKITAIFIAVLSHRGALANVTNAGRDAVSPFGVTR